MKKEFKLTDPKKAPARQVDAVKHEINKYITRERKKKVTEGVDFWDFDCKFGKDQASAVVIHVFEINKFIDKQVMEESSSVYVEIIAKPGHRAKTKK
jgi:hypothetical protein